MQMKKILLTLFVAVCSLSTSAQLWLGGEFGLYGSKIKDADEGNYTFTLSPEVGYDINDSWAIAAAINFSHNNDSYDLNHNSFGINPYARFSFAKVGQVKFFIDGGLEFGLTSDEVSTSANVGKSKSDHFYIDFRPGLYYGFCEKAGLVAHLGDLYFHHNWNPDSDYKLNSFGLRIWNSASFGVYFNL